MKKFYILATTILLAATASAQQQKSLKDIVMYGKSGDIYTISDNLVGVYVPPRYKNVVFAKDNNNHYQKSAPTQAQVNNYRLYDIASAFDQSNWIKILFPRGYDASQYEGKVISNTIGRVNVSDAPAGPVGLYIDVDVYSPANSAVKVDYPTIGTAASYSENTFSPANFVEQTTWFFVQPKNQEYATIHWAVYDGGGKFYVPKCDGAQNSANIAGSFTVNMILWEEQDAANSVTADQVFEPGTAYEFPAIIEYATGNTIGVGIDPGWGGPDFDDVVGTTDVGADGFDVGEGGAPSDDYRVMVYPLRLSKPGVITGVEQSVGEREAMRVQYCDLQGRVSDKPHRGLNIVVTTWSDGTTTSTKLIK